MKESAAVLEIDKPHFTVKLYESMLKVDLKGSVKNEIEEALENKPVLRETIGGLLGIFAPLHIRLAHVDSVRIEKTGKLKLVLPLHRDIVIPLEPEEAKKLMDKLNQLIPEAKQKELERAIMEKKDRKIAQTEHEPSHELVQQPGGIVFPIPKPPRMLKEEREAEKQIEEEIEKEEG